MSDCPMIPATEALLDGWIGPVVDLGMVVVAHGRSPRADLLAPVDLAGHVDDAVGGLAAGGVEADMAQRRDHNGRALVAVRARVPQAPARLPCRHCGRPRRCVEHGYAADACDFEHVYADPANLSALLDQPAALAEAWSKLVDSEVAGG